MGVRWLPCRLAVAPGLAVVCLSWRWCRQFWRVFWRALVLQCLESCDGGKSSARLRTTSITLQLLPHNTQGRAGNSRTAHDTHPLHRQEQLRFRVHRFLKTPPCRVLAIAARRQQHEATTNCRASNRCGRRLQGQSCGLRRGTFSMSNPSDSGGAGVSPKLPKMSNGSSNSMHEMAVLSSCKASDFTVGQVRVAMLAMLTLCFAHVCFVLTTLPPRTGSRSWVSAKWAWSCV